MGESVSDQTLPCPQCGRANSADARFCQQCGSSLEPAAPEQRKVVTVIFCDVTGSTTLGEQLDPEVLRGVMGRFYDAARTVVLRHEGRVEKFIGDAVVAVFGVPVAREDDALRAVRAAAEIHDEVAALATQVRTQYDVALAVRTGVNTGEVVVGEARAGGSFATGDAVNTAARLEQSAQPGQIVLGETTHRLVAGAVVAEPLAPLSLRGKQDAVGTYLLRSVGAAPERSFDTPFIGRARERALLAEALSRVVESQTGALVTVVGDAGLGKSRLVGDLLASVGSAALVLRGRCLSYGEGITFWPVVEVLRAAATLDGSEPPTVVSERLAALVDSHPDAGAVAAQLGPLLGVGGEPGRIDDVIWAFRTVVEHLAEQHPVVLDIDDVHWAEPPLLDLIEDVQRSCRDLPLLVLCQARPEFLSQRPGWATRAGNVTTVRLEPLNDTDATDLLTKISGLEPAAVEQVMAAAGGNPLYLEQLVAHVREATDGRSLTGVPPTLAALLAARLDQLDEHERETVACAAIVGQVFHLGEVVAVSGELGEHEVMDALESVSDRQIVRRSRQDGRDAYRFRHVLVQDAAYDAQSKKQRAQRHLRYADWLGEHPGEAAGELDAIRGWHLEQAHNLLLEVAPGEDTTRSAASAAAECLERAAHSRSAVDIHAAITLLARSAALTETPAWRAERLLRRAYLTWTLQEAVIDVLDEIAAVRPAGGPALHAVAGAMRVAAKMNEDVNTLTQELDDAVDHAYRLCRLQGWTWGQALTRIVHVQSANMQGQWGLMVEMMKDVARLAAIAGDDVMQLNAEIVQCTALRWSPAPVEECLRVTDELLTRLADAPGTRARLAFVKAGLVAMTGELDLALEQLSPEPPPEDGLTHQVWAFACIHTLFDAGDHTAVAEVALTAADASAKRGDPAHASTLYGWAAAFFLDVGDVERGRDATEQTRQTTGAEDALSQALLHLCLGQLAVVDGNHDTARALLNEANEWMDVSDHINEQAVVRFLAASALLRAGDREAAGQLLREARARFERKGNRPALHRCDEQLAELT